LGAKRFTTGGIDMAMLHFSIDSIRLLFVRELQFYVALSVIGEILEYVKRLSLANIGFYHHPVITGVDDLSQ